MTQLSLKNAILLASALSFSLGMSAFAAQTKTECTTNPLFAANDCNTCYTEQFEGQKATTGWKTELSTVKIPWEHGGGDLGEIILESEQKLPEIIPSTGVTVTPVEADKVWESGTDIIWYGVGSTDREYWIPKGTTNTLYTLQTGVKLNAAGMGKQDTILIKAGLVYGDFEPDLNEVGQTKTRNICLLGKINTEIGGTVTPPVDEKKTPPVDEKKTPPVDEKKTPPVDEKIPLNAAGPGKDVVIEPEQTEPKSGPEFWIFLLLAFAFSGAWTAWKKQKA